MATRVPQYGPTIPYPLVGPRHGRFPIHDRHGNGCNLAAILDMYTRGRSRLPFSEDRTIERVSGLKIIRVRITWPGYLEFHGYVRMGSLADLMIGIAFVYHEFMRRAPILENKGEERADESAQWNITANKLTVRELALTAIVHHMDDIFYCDVERVVQKPKPRPS